MGPLSVPSLCFWPRAQGPDPTTARSSWLLGFVLARGLLLLWEKGGFDYSLFL